MKYHHIEVPHNDRCAFCDYLAGIRNYTILRRTELSAILVTREQRGRSHVLAIPIRHCETVLELRPDESAIIMQDIVEVARAIESTEHADGIAVWQNNGVPAGQAIAHLHFHVAATLPGGGTERGDVPEITLAETDQIADLLRQHLN